MRPLRAVWSVVLLLAGCAAPAVESPDRGEEPAALRYAECRGLEAFVPVPIEEARAAMPEGYEPAPFDDTGALGSFVALVSACGSVAAGAIELGAGGYGFAMLLAIPPSGKANPEAAAEALVLRQMVSHEEARTLLASWGHTRVVVGSAEVALVDAVAGAHRVSGVLEGDGLRIASEGAFTRAPAAGDPYIVRLHDATGVPILDAFLQGDPLAEGQGTTSVSGVGFDGARAGAMLHRAPAGLHVEMRQARAGDA